MWLYQCADFKIKRAEVEFCPNWVKMSSHVLKAIPAQVIDHLESDSKTGLATCVSIKTAVEGGDTLLREHTWW